MINVFFFKLFLAAAPVAQAPPNMPVQYAVVEGQHIPVTPFRMQVSKFVNNIPFENK